MPKMTAKATAPKIVHSLLTVHHRYAGIGGEGPITYDEMRKWLGVETEEAFRERTGYTEEREFSEEEIKNISIVRNPATDEAIALHNNIGNREFRMDDCLKLMQEILQRKWAGPTNYPGETVNGETIAISRTGKCISIQHRGVAFLWAVEEWRRNPEKYPQWKEEPVLESLVVFGVSDSPNIVQTVDCGRTRTDPDMLYTTGMLHDKQLDVADQKELSRKLAGAIDLVWKRTRGHDQEGHKYRTHSVTKEFLDNHLKLRDCVRFVFDLDSGESGRPLSLLRLNAGEIAGLMYLFAASHTDLDRYVGDNRSERRIDFKHWNKAEQFVKGLASSEKFEPVREALSSLKDAEEGLGGRQTEKHATLVKAWNLFVKGKPFDEAALLLEYGQNPNTGDTVLTDWPRCGGIDQGDPRGDTERPPTPEEIEEAKEEAKVHKAQACERKEGKRQEKQVSMTTTLEQLKEVDPDRLLVFQTNDEAWDVWGDDARIVAIDLDLKAVQNKDHDWLLHCSIPCESMNQYLRLLSAKNKIGLVKQNDKGGWNVTDYQKGKK